MNFDKGELSSFVDINSESISKKNAPDEIIYLDISSVKSGWATFPDNPRPYALAPGRARRRVRHGDVILSMVRPNLRSFLRIQNPPENLIVSTGFAVLRPLEEINPDFLYFTIRNQEFTDYLELKATGSAYPAVDQKIISKAMIHLPSLEQQQEIAQILDSYEVLARDARERITTIERFVETLYVEWFEKYNFPGHREAKKVDTELPIATAYIRFSGPHWTHYIASFSEGEAARLDIHYNAEGLLLELWRHAHPPLMTQTVLKEDERIRESDGLIPEGWVMTKLGEIAEIDKGLSYKGKYLGRKNGSPMANLKCIVPGGGYRRDGTKSYSGKYSERHTVRGGDLIFANTDLKQDGSIIGSPAIVPNAGFENNGLASHHISIVRLKENGPIGLPFLHQIMKFGGFREWAQAYSSGTTVLGFRSSDSKKFEFLLPTEELSTIFNEIATEALRCIELLHQVSEVSSSTRDLLLPRLLSGEVIV